MGKTYHLHIHIIPWPEEEPFSMGTNSLFTPPLELNQFTLAENLTLCFQIVDLPVPHRAWQLGKGISKFYVVFRNSVTDNMCTILAITYTPLLDLNTSDFTSCKDWQEHPHTDFYANNVLDYRATA